MVVTQWFTHWFDIVFILIYRGIVAGVILLAWSVVRWFRGHAR